MRVLMKLKAEERMCLALFARAEKQGMLSRQMTCLLHSLHRMLWLGWMMCGKARLAELLWSAVPLLCQTHPVVPRPALQATNRR